MPKCKNHPERDVTPFDVGDNFCRECFMKAENAGARQADATWHQPPTIRPQDERAPDGRNVYQEMQRILQGEK